MPSSCHISAYTTPILILLINSWYSNLLVSTSSPGKIIRIGFMTSATGTPQLGILTTNQPQHHNLPKPTQKLLGKACVMRSDSSTGPVWDSLPQEPASLRGPQGPAPTERLVKPGEWGLARGAPAFLQFSENSVLNISHVNLEKCMGLRGPSLESLRRKVQITTGKCPTSLDCDAGPWIART